MSAAECLALQELGAQWYATVALQPDGGQRATNRNAILQRLAAMLPQHITIKRGFQDYDPVVRVHGVAYKYSEIADWAASQSDGGLSAAQRFGAWATRHDVTLEHLEPQLQALAVITCFAEKARNLYDPMKLGEWMNSILGAATIPGRQSAWRDYETKWPASLSYKTDAAMDWA